ncbi:MAG TPA: YggT family protein [Anaerolineales bacterium]|nr:YggT family protein [Anaerolineales bacterium]
MTDYQEVRTTQHEPGQEQRVATFKLTQLVWLLLGVLETALALRFMFKLIAVNAANPFASLLYKVTDIFVAPFASLTGAPAAGEMVLEISTIIAMIVYFLLGWVLERIIYVLFYRPRGPVSVRQTITADHIPQQAPVDVSQTVTTTERTTTQSP